MSSYLVLWIAFSCPGGLLSGLIPAAARPYSCARAPRAEISPREHDAHRRVRELGPGARLLACKGIRCSERRVTWEQVAAIEGAGG